MGTREALYGFNVLIPRWMNVNPPVYVCFLDYNKAFGNVHHKNLLRLLKNKDINNKDIRGIAFNQTAYAKLGDEVSEEVNIERGIRQGCVL